MPHRSDSVAPQQGGERDDCRRNGVIATTTVVLALAAGLIVALPRTALAACGGTLSLGGILVTENQSPIRGNRADIWVNNFDSHQYQSWRQVNVFQNPNNFAEVGWVTGEVGNDQLAHPFKTFFNNSVGQTIRFNAINITPRDDHHQFAVKDPDDDNSYVFTLDGDTLGTPNTASIAATQAITDGGAERACTSDSLWAEFQALQAIDNSQGNWNNWSNVINDINQNKSPYFYCAVSNHAFNVRQNCP